MDDRGSWREKREGSLVSDVATDVQRVATEVRVEAELRLPRVVTLADR
jgi:hypothetical protein